MSETYSLPGKSGITYTFSLYLWEPTWNEVGAVYVVLRQTPSGKLPLYVGESDNIKRRHSNHERRQDFLRHGVTHIAAMVEQHDGRRKAIETDLVQWHEPLLNKTSHG